MRLWASGKTADSKVIMQAVPSGYGQRLSWCFPFLPSYWRGTSNSTAEKPSAGTLSRDMLLAEEHSGSAAVAIRHLCKDFRTTDGYTKRAVDDLSLDVAASQVTALLGEPACIKCMHAPVCHHLSMHVLLLPHAHTTASVLAARASSS